MTSFGKFFKQLFKQKNRTVYLILAIQLIAAVIMTLIAIFSGSLYINDDPTMAGVKVNYFTTTIFGIVGAFLVFSVIAEPVYLLMTSWRNEKINRSQTWRLAPISDSKFYLANTLSSFASYVYLAVAQIIISLIAALLCYVSSANVRKGVAKMCYEISKESPNANWGTFYGDLAEVCILVFLAGLLWYVMISFYHFAYRSVMDFLPANSKFVLLLVKLITLVVVIYLFSQIVAVTTTSMINLASWSNGKFDNSLINAIVEFLIFDLIFGGLNLWLINKFVEAKQN